ncbi:MAG: hypothetical protein ACE361_18880 [Aureliella sp.]
MSRELAGKLNILQSLFFAAAILWCAAYTNSTFWTFMLIAAWWIPFSYLNAHTGRQCCHGDRCDVV